MHLWVVPEVDVLADCVLVLLHTHHGRVIQHSRLSTQLLCLGRALGVGESFCLSTFALPLPQLQTKNQARGVVIW